MDDLPDNVIGFEAVGEVDAGVVPGEIKVYPTADVAAAKDWAAE